jgi:1-acyl-sn-glycerol-3-phosphate acyltransferase
MHIMSLWVVALALAGVAALFFACKWLPAIRRAQALGAKYQECGVLGPAPDDEKQKKLLAFARGLIRLFVGKVDVKNNEKLATMPGPFILIFNHGSMLDLAVAPYVLNRKARYPAAQGVMRAFGNAAGGWFGSWGAYSVDLDNGAAALKASVKVLTSNDEANVICLFPEAWTHMDGTVRNFKSGTARMAREAARILGRPVYIVPGYMRYGRYLSGWMTKLPIPIQWLIPIVGFAWYRRGCKVAIGDAISSADLPDDPHQATELLKSRVLALDPAHGCK